MPHASFTLQLVCGPKGNEPHPEFILHLRLAEAVIKSRLKFTLVSVAIIVFLSLSVCLFICLSVLYILSIWLSVCQDTYLSICRLFINLFIIDIPYFLKTICVSVRTFLTMHFSSFCRITLSCMHPFVIFFFFFFTVFLFRLVSKLDLFLPDLCQSGVRICPL